MQVKRRPRIPKGRERQHVVKVRVRQDHGRSAPSCEPFLELHERHAGIHDHAVVPPRRAQDVRVDRERPARQLFDLVGH